MADESIDVVPSEDSGNVPAEEVAAVTPSETTPPGDPAVTPDPVTTPVAPELFELPDGRKVDAATLSREWKENFMPEFTRKSQDLARVQTPANPVDPNINKDPTKNPDWVPQTYDEILERAEQRVFEKMEAREKAQEQARQNIENEIATQLSEVKKVDATVDENALFLHATKYGFRDLRHAHANMKDMSAVVKKAQTTTAQNIAKRNDPVSVVPGATGVKPNPSQFSSAVEYMRALRGNQ